MSATSPAPIPCTLLRGDGIGPEIVDATLRVLEVLGAPYDWHDKPAGLGAFERYGDPLPADTLADMQQTRLALKGPLTTPIGGGFRSINVRLREALKLYANVRPGLSMLPDGKFQDVDIVLIRENTGGFYVGVEHFIAIGDDPHAVAEATGILTRENCQRISRYAFEYAVATGRKKITVVHKANILKALTGLFLETVTAIAKEYEGRVKLEDRIVDNCAMQLVINPSQFDIILTTNMFGDILSDEIAGLIGGLGLAPGANIGAHAAMFEAVHGSAPDIAGQGIANPTALLLAAAMMLDHCRLHALAARLRQGLTTTLAKASTRTRDLGGRLSTQEFARAVIANL
ncbi:MAG: isocitrate/isopropylmalate dehydrogenase family protein [Gammaproteobacteria bacterium]